MMTKIEALRSDLAGSPSGMMAFQQAFIVYLATQGYEGFIHTLIISKDGAISCDIDPDLTDPQKADLTHQIQNLKSVTIKKVGDSLEYTFNDI